MLALFKQTYKKLLFTPSTLLFTLILAFIFKLSFTLGTMFGELIWIRQGLESIVGNIILQFNVLFTWFMLPPFVAVKCAGFIVDELEDGTFLTILSKPISRTNIILQKLAALFFVNATFIFAILCLGWWFGFKDLPYTLTFDLFIASLPVMFIIPFVISLFLSILLIVLSLKLKSSLIIGIGTGIGFFSYLSPVFINNIVIENTAYQGGVGTIITKETYNRVNSKQQAYANFKFLNYTQHADQIYLTNIAKSLVKFNLDNQILARINKEVIFDKYSITEKDKVGKEITKTKYRIKTHKFWILNSILYKVYAILTILILLYGFFYFKRKDIV